MATSGRLLSCWCPVSSAQTSRNGQCQHFEFVKQSAEPVPSTKSTNCCPLAPWSPLRPHSHFTGLRSQNAMQLWHVQIRFSKDAWDTWGGWCSWYGWGGWGGWGGCWAAAFGASKLYAAKLEGSHVLRSSEDWAQYLCSSLLCENLVERQPRPTSTIHICLCGPIIGWCCSTW